ncbi:BTB/POZ domain-containing protein 3-like [Paramacrobiotus metropolitanus]|uniref:BTB/POZ domain-containing protein 3-like n=1 Tax=Paramacrobiotus metropolitanus TaxID=2943436 RepID=UPI002445F816|nr:BTB/POZ domain-containing protein 3-like [Paramacrobiotus metropolitanus]
MSQNSAQSTATESCAGVAKVADRVKDILLCEDMSDIRFAVGRDHGAVKIFPAHRVIIGLRSVVFHTMFYGSLPDMCTDLLDIPDIHPEAFANMLSYIYTDAVTNFTQDNVFDTLKCADKYDLPLLLTMCTDFVLGTLNLNNCLHVLDNAVHYAGVAPSILEKCLCLIDESPKSIWQSDQFCAIGQEALRTILKRDTLTANEHTICSAVDKWAEITCMRRDMDGTSANRREVLGEVLFLVGFPLLSDGQLLDGPVKTGLLLQSELLDIYHYKHAAIKPPLPFRKEPRQNVRGECVINYTVPDVRKLQAIFTLSNPVTARKLFWHIHVGKETEANVGFYLVCSSYPKSASWACEVNAELRLLPWNTETAPIKKQISHLFGKNGACWGYGFGNFISMENLLDPTKGYIDPSDFSLKLQIQVTVSPFRLETNECSETRT